MNDLENNIAILGKPYTITSSRLGAITKVYNDSYICDLSSLKELLQSLGEKLAINQEIKIPEFSFLMSYSDKTHQDGITPDFREVSSIPTGKLTDRIVMRWAIFHSIDGIENELSVTVRISNPINPLIFLQAALSKSPNEIDNMEFEMGATCVTVNGSTQIYADEVFLLIQKWIDARNKPHAFIHVKEIYEKLEWYIDQFNRSLFPLLITALFSFLMYKYVSADKHTVVIPILIALFFVVRSVANKINHKMAEWADRSKYMGLFQITNGDIDCVTKMASRAKNGAFKLISVSIFSLALNITAGIFCWWLLPN